MAHNFQVFSQLIGYSPTLFAWSKSYTPKNLSGKYFKLVETFLIVVVSENVFSGEIDKDDKCSKFPSNPQTPHTNLIW